MKELTETRGFTLIMLSRLGWFESYRRYYDRKPLLDADVALGSNPGRNLKVV